MLKTVNCPGCQAAYRIDSDKIPPGGGTLTCPTCGRRWTVRPGEAEVVHAPAPAAPPAKGAAVACPRCGHHFVPGTEAGQPRKTVLVVDDQEFFRNFAVDLLSDRYDIHVAKSVDEALKKSEELHPALIVLDLGLDGGADDGRRVLERVGGQVPVIIMTGRTDFDPFGEDWRLLEQLGARNLVIKSMSIGEELRAKVAALIDS